MSEEECLSEEALYNQIQSKYPMILVKKLPVDSQPETSKEDDFIKKEVEEVFVTEESFEVDDHANDWLMSKKVQNEELHEVSEREKEGESLESGVQANFDTQIDQVVWFPEFSKYVHPYLYGEVSDPRSIKGMRTVIIMELNNHLNSCQLLVTTWKSKRASGYRTLARKLLEKYPKIIRETGSYKQAITGDLGFLMRRLAYKRRQSVKKRPVSCHVSERPRKASKLIQTEITIDTNISVGEEFLDSNETSSATEVNKDKDISVGEEFLDSNETSSAIKTQITNDKDISVGEEFLDSNETSSAVQTEVTNDKDISVGEEFLDSDETSLPLKMENTNDTDISVGEEFMDSDETNLPLKSDEIPWLPEFSKAVHPYLYGEVSHPKAISTMRSLIIVQLINHLNSRNLLVSSCRTRQSWGYRTLAKELLRTYPNIIRETGTRKRSPKGDVGLLITRLADRRRKFYKKVRETSINPQEDLNLWQRVLQTRLVRRKRKMEKMSENSTKTSEEVFETRLASQKRKLRKILSESPQEDLDPLQFEEVGEENSLDENSTKDEDISVGKEGSDSGKLESDEVAWFPEFSKEVHPYLYGQTSDPEYIRLMRSLIISELIDHLNFCNLLVDRSKTRQSWGYRNLGWKLLAKYPKIIRETSSRKRVSKADLGPLMSTLAEQRRKIFRKKEFSTSENPQEILTLQQEIVKIKLAHQGRKIRTILETGQTSGSPQEDSDPLQCKEMEEEKPDEISTSREQESDGINWLPEFSREVHPYLYGQTSDPKSINDMRSLIILELMEHLNSSNLLVDTCRTKQSWGYRKFAMRLLRKYPKIIRETCSRKRASKGDLGLLISRLADRRRKMLRSADTSKNPEEVLALKQGILRSSLADRRNKEVSESCHTSGNFQEHSDVLQCKEMEEEKPDEVSTEDRNDISAGDEISTSREQKGDKTPWLPEFPKHVEPYLWGKVVSPKSVKKMRNVIVVQLIEHLNSHNLLLPSTSTKGNQSDGYQYLAKLMLKKYPGIIKEKSGSERDMIKGKLGHLFSILAVKRTTIFRQQRQADLSSEHSQENNGEVREEELLEEVSSKEGFENQEVYSVSESDLIKHGILGEQEFFESSETSEELKAELIKHGILDEEFLESKETAELKKEDVNSETALEEVAATEENLVLETDSAKETDRRTWLPQFSRHVDPYLQGTVRNPDVIAQMRNCIIIELIEHLNSHNLVAHPSQVEQAKGYGCLATSLLEKYPNIMRETSHRKIVPKGELGLLISRLADRRRKVLPNLKEERCTAESSIEDWSCLKTDSIKDGMFETVYVKEEPMETKLSEEEEEDEEEDEDISVRKKSLDSTKTSYDEKTDVIAWLPNFPKCVFPYLYGKTTNPVQIHKMRNVILLELVKHLNSCNLLVDHCRTKQAWGYRHLARLILRKYPNIIKETPSRKRASKADLGLLISRLADRRLKMRYKMRQLRQEVG